MADLYRYPWPIVCDPWPTGLTLMLNTISGESKAELSDATLEWSIVQLLNLLTDQRWEAINQYFVPFCCCPVVRLSVSSSVMRVYPGWSLARLLPLMLDKGMNVVQILVEFPMVRSCGRKIKNWPDITGVRPYQKTDNDIVTPSITWDRRRELC